MSTHIGRQSEELIAQVLHKQGHKILALNWRTRSCEIDIVSRYKKIVYMTEVKFRSKAMWGSGFEYITNKKLAQMRYAAELWVLEHQWSGDVRLLGASVTGDGDTEVIALDG